MQPDSAMSSKAMHHIARLGPKEGSPPCCPRKARRAARSRLQSGYADADALAREREVHLCRRNDVQESHIVPICADATRAQPCRKEWGRECGHRALRCRARQSGRRRARARTTHPSPLKR
jgi:hypothetical protein